VTVADVVERLRTEVDQTGAAKGKRTPRPTCHRGTTKSAQCRLGPAKPNRWAPRQIVGQRAGQGHGPVPGAQTVVLPGVHLVASPATRVGLAWGDGRQLGPVRAAVAGVSQPSSASMSG
jgi:hypothetical protein